MTPEASSDPNVIQVILNVFRGQEGITRIRGAAAGRVWTAAGLFALEGAVVLMLGFALAVPGGTSGMTLWTVSVIPVLLTVLLGMVSLGLQALAGKGRFALVEAAFAGAVAAWALAVLIGFALLMLYLSIQYFSDSFLFNSVPMLLLLGGIGYAAVLLSTLWSHLLDIRGGWAMVLSPWAVVLALGLGLYLWTALFGLDTDSWNPMLYL